MAPLLQQLFELRGEAIAHQQRRMAVIAGDLVWCNALATALVDHLDEAASSATLWLARDWPEPANRLQQIIGGESQLLIFNAHHGFDPNLFGAASGTLVGGGLLLLLSPSFERWPHKSDPVSSRIAVYPHLPETISNRYIQRLIRTLEEGEREARLQIMHQSTEPAQPETSGAHRPERGLSVNSAAQGRGTPEQQRAIAAIIHTATGHRHRPLVIIAERGRGKSAALGIAAAQLLGEGLRHIVITAPSRAAVDTLFKHADLGGEAHSQLEFVAPDNLIRQPATADLILVDEAAAIPTPILIRIVKRHSRVVFATTTHGYEGSGQGFALRFLNTLRQLEPNYCELQLNSPIRWAEGDPVEEQTNQMLLLDAEPELSSRVRPHSTLQIDRIERLERDALAHDEPLLRQLFGLLVLAHYHTTPLDLRQLLDGPNLTIYCATHKNRVVATALVADEGEIDGELPQEIWLGRRRPQGHLLPQTLVAHLGIRAAAALRYRRIIRIAVHPELQRQGIGRKLMDRITADAITDRVDLMGASYGATTGLIDFWSQNQLTPVFIGGHRSASSGTYALSQMRALSQHGKPILELAVQRFQNNLTSQLRGPLRELESEIIQRILKPIPFHPDRCDRDDIDAFSDGQRRYETVITPLYQLLMGHFDKVTELPPRAQQLLIMRLLQNRSYACCSAQLGMGGKTAILTEMRGAIALLRNCP